MSWQVLFLKTQMDPKSQHSPFHYNRERAYTLAALLFPLGYEPTEMEMFEKITGLSYAGDPRMVVPGAENPEKVKNIVQGQGALPAFRDAYDMEQFPYAPSFQEAGDKIQVSQTSRHPIPVTLTDWVTDAQYTREQAALRHAPPILLQVHPLLPILAKSTGRFRLPYGLCWSHSQESATGGGEDAGGARRRRQGIVICRPAGRLRQGCLGLYVSNLKK